MNSQTIVALASGGGRAAVAVVRISGRDAGSVLAAVAGPLPQPRRASLRRLHDPGTGREIDHGLVLWFPGPASFTGEDCVELQVHGGRAVVAAVLRALEMQPGCRLAEPGEFTRRAFLNGRMDLPAVEGLADLIDAQTEAQRRQALRQMDGALGTWVATQRSLLLQALATAESAIDFADEGDIAGDLEGEVIRLVGEMHAAVAQELGRFNAAARLRQGLVVALAGPPNAGKSTLLNALARREAAIVSPHAGTTRDPIEVDLDLDGHLVVCVDTAGLRPSKDPVEREGIARALSRAAGADLVLWLQDAREPPQPDLALVARRLWIVATKADLGSGVVQGHDFVLSAATGQGLPDLLDGLRACAADGDVGGEAGVVTRLRHRRALQDAEAHLALIEHGGGLEVVAEQLRHVSRSFDVLTGRISSEEILGEIFARFCIGK